MEEELKKTDNQNESRPWLFKKGQSGNPAGRPKGKTLKEYCRDFLACMTEEERTEFLNGLDKETIWKMAEGNPDNKTKFGGENGDELQPILVKFINGNENNNNTRGVQKTV